MDSNFDDENEPILGQMSYDELLQNVHEEEKQMPKEKIVSGQIDIFDFAVTNQSFNKNLNEERKLENKKPKQSIEKILSPTGDGLIFKTIDEVIHESMIPYTEHVVMDRALPRVEDGLKPVQRRILYTMLELNLEPDKQFRKSARIVGDCMGKYHPHGDSSVYDAMVRMAQSYSMSEPLVDGHGNFGSIDGDSAAAMRYTEAKLTPLAMELLRDLNKGTVSWSLNFDDTLKEPDMLPGRFPNLLVNGASGIAVGVATSIPPHNLTEVCDAVVAYINKPSIKLEEIMNYIKAPDFPTGGQLIAGEELINAYRTGKGKVTIRATVNIESSGDKENIVITEIPYQVNKAVLLQKIAELKESNKDKLSAISEIRDESDRNGMRAVIKVKKEGNTKAILEYLYKATNLQTSFAINMVAIANGKPKQMGLLDIISYYVEYQRQVVYRRTKYDLEQCKDRAHILEGLLIAIKNIDEVVKIIKKSATVAEAKQKLKDRFNLSEKQAQSILDMRLARLVNLEQTKIVEELKELKAKIEQLLAIFNSKKLQLDVVKTELVALKKQFKCERQSKLATQEQFVCEMINEDEAFAKEVMIAVTASDTIKIIPSKNYALAQKEITSNSSLHDVHKILVPALTSHDVLLFTNLGNCVKVKVGDIPFAKWRDKGITLAGLDKNIIQNEKVVFVYVLDNLEDTESELLFYTTSGMVKRTKLCEYFISKSYCQAIKLKDKDTCIGIEIFNKDKSIFMLTKQGMGLNFESLDIPLMGRVSGGVKGMNIEQGDMAVFATQVTNSGAITVGCENGYFKNIPVGEFEVMARYRKGLRLVQLLLTGEVMFGYYGLVPPYVAVKTERGIEKVLSKQIAYDSRLGKGKQNIKAKVQSIYEYKH